MSGCEEVEKQVPQSKERDELVRFIRESKRGIIKPYESRIERGVKFPYKYWYIRNFHYICNVERQSKW